MRTIFLILFFCSICKNVMPQVNSDLKFIFVPHPRSEDKVHQSVLKEIEKINFSLYDMVLLGGDITYYTSISRVSMNYCDSLFNLDSPNTLWTMGNHDLNNPSLIAEYTKRPRFYSYYRDSICFVVLDTEQNANGFTSSYILGNQLKMLDYLRESKLSSLLNVYAYQMLVLLKSWFSNFFKNISSSFIFIFLIFHFIYDPHA